MLDFLKSKLTPGGGGRALKVAPLFSVPLDHYKSTGERDAILASSGMGKSYLTGVLMEETLEAGGLLCVIDPEGEHFTLAERYPMMIIGGEQANLPLVEEAIDLYVDTMLKIGLSAVFDLSEYLDDEQQHLFGLIADKLFQAEQKYRRKVRLVVEEAQIYAPQRTMGGAASAKGAKAKMDPLVASQKIAKRGRKRALDSLWATQRPASISKDILSQCNRFWFGGINAEQDYKAIKPFLNEAGISFADIKSLSPGEFFFFSKGQTKKIKVRKRYCRHAGATPEAGMTFHATTNSSMKSAITMLADAIAERAHEKEQEDSQINQLKAQIRELKQLNEKLRKELEQEQLATKVIDRIGGISSSTSRTRTRKLALTESVEKELEAMPKITREDIAARIAEQRERLHPSKIMLD